MTYFDLNLNLTEEDKAIREAAHKFAKEVMRLGQGRIVPC